MPARPLRQPPAGRLRRGRRFSASATSDSDSESEFQCGRDLEAYGRPLGLNTTPLALSGDMPDFAAASECPGRAGILISAAGSLSRPAGAIMMEPQAYDRGRASENYIMIGLTVTVTRARGRD